MSLEPKLYCASEIGNLLGLTRQAVHSILAQTQPDQVEIRDGKQVELWIFATLPARLQERLNQAALKCRRRDGEHLLSDPPRRQEGQTSSEAQISEARKLKAALARMIERRSEFMDRKARAEMIEMGVADYQREFGRPITEKHLVNLYWGVIDRAGDLENFELLNIYTRGKACKPGSVKESPLEDCQFDSVAAVIEAFGNPLEPKLPEESLLWRRTFECFTKLASQGKPSKIKARLLDFLWRRVPKLSVSRAALRRTFERKLPVWIRQGREFRADARCKEPGEPKPEVCDPDQLDLLRYVAAKKTGKDLPAALRLMNRSGLITDPKMREDAERCENGSSYVRASIRQEVTIVPSYNACTLGASAIEKMTPPMDLTQDGIFSMDCVTGDDLTCPVYFSVSDGNGWYRMTRGQTILICDFRTLRILSHALHPEPQYNALVVRTALVTAFEKFGLPKFIYREGGIWRRSHLVNSLPGMRAPFSEAEIEDGLEKRGVKFRSDPDELIHDLGELRIQFREAYCARAKPIERVCGLVQDLMEGEPGYCGRDERRDCPEQVRKAIAAVEARKAHPKELGFYSFEEWFRRQGEIFSEFNAKRQGGRRLSHPSGPISPDEGFEIFKNRQAPNTKFDDSCRFLLSHIRTEVKVKSPNVRRGQFPCGYVEIRGNRYCDGAKLVPGKKLLAFWNPDKPETCTFTDLKMRAPFTVPVLKPTNALYPGEQFKESASQARSVSSAIRTQYRALESKYEHLFRRNLVSARTAELGHEIETGQARIDAQEKAEASQSRAGRTVAAQLNISPAMIKTKAELEAAQELQSLLAEPDTSEEEKA
jgi:hypothetical protein